MAWAQEVCRLLINERKRGQLMTDSHRKEYMKYEETNEIHWEPIDIHELPNNIKQLKIKLLNLQEWDERNHWQRKSALLPELAAEHLEKWVEAGIAFLTAGPATESYMQIVGQQEFERSVKRDQVRKCLLKTRNQCSKRCGAHGKPSGARASAIEEEYMELLTTEITIIKKWKQHIRAAMDNHTWPVFIEDRRARGKSAESACREQLKRCFAAICESHIKA
jgi:hypothetical protein